MLQKQIKIKSFKKKHEQKTKYFYLKKNYICFLYKIN